MMLLEGKFGEGDTISVDAKGGDLTFNRSAKGGPRGAQA
jgi:hypothetical protein